MARGDLFLLYIVVKTPFGLPRHQYASISRWRSHNNCVCAGL